MSKLQDTPPQLTENPVTAELVGPGSDGGMGIPSGLSALGPVVPSSIPPGLFEDPRPRGARPVAPAPSAGVPSLPVIGKKFALPHPPPRKPASSPRVPAVIAPAISRIPVAEAVSPVMVAREEPDAPTIPAPARAAPSPSPILPLPAPTPTI